VLDSSSLYPDLDDRYLLLNGSRAMAGNLDLATYALLTSNLAFYEYTSTTFAITNRAKTLYRNLILAGLIASSVTTSLITSSASISVEQSLVPTVATLSLGSASKHWYDGYVDSLYSYVQYSDAILSTAAGNDLTLKTQNSALRSIKMQSYDTALRTVLQAINGRVNLPRAGDVVMMGAFQPRRVVDINEPIPDIGELMIWTDETNVWLMYNDATLGTKKVQLT